MASSAGNLSEEQVHCSICLDVFTNPVSIPCGHNFCQSCILGYWKTGTSSYQCPMCKKAFYKRPDISVNTVLREIAEQFKEIRVRGGSGGGAAPEAMEAEPEEEAPEKRWTMDLRRRAEDEERLLEVEQKERLMEELRQRQEEKRKKESSPPQEDLPPLLPPPPPFMPPAATTASPPTSPPVPPARAVRRTPPSTPPGGQPPPALPQATPPPSPQIVPGGAQTTPPPPQQPPPASPPPSPPRSPCQWQEEVLCDVCLGEGRPRAVKACLVCLTSYCEEHLKAHSARFTKHKLMEPVANMEERMCQKHERLLELFCKKDQALVCVLCTETDHRSHYTVPVEREWIDRKAQLKRTEIDVQQMIQDRLQKVEEIKHSVELNKVSAESEMEDTKRVFSDLVRSIQKIEADMILAIEKQQKQTATRAQVLIAELEQEIGELKRRNKDLETLSRTDHVHFLQSFPALSIPPTVKDWSGTSVATDMCIGMIRQAVTKFQATLQTEIQKLADDEIKKLRKYTVDLTLDPDTANPWLQLSQDRRQVRHLGAWQDLPDTPDRFDTVVIVLGRHAITSGRHYWEVQVGDKDDWYLGVARSSVNRRGRISVSSGHGYWALAMKRGQGYRVSSVPPLALDLEVKLKRVGVYVDYEEGHVSFYDLRARTHIHTLRDRFTEKLYPFFYLYCCDKASDTMAIVSLPEKTSVKTS